MTDSLTLSLLLFFALVVLVVLAREVWRLMGLRSDRVRAKPRAQREETREPAPGRVSSVRREPGLDSLDLPSAVRIEPDFPLPEGTSGPQEGMAPAGYEVSSQVDATAIPEASRERLTPSERASDEAPFSPLPEAAVDCSAVRAGVDVADVREATSPGLPKSSQSGDDSAWLAGPTLSITTDCIIDLAFGAPVPGERLVSIAQGFRRCGTKPVLIEVPIPGATAASPRQWRPPQSSEGCRAMRIGILLDNRSGPLNAMEFSEFLARVDETAERLGARYSAPQMSDVLKAARRLDADCAHLDWNASLNVDAPEVLGPGQLAALAGPLLIVERGSNRYARLDECGDPVFSVSLGDRPNRLTFLLDLPRVLQPQDAWRQMVECALIAAKRMPGRLVDDSGKPLTEQFLESSAMQVHQRALALEAVGLKAGTAIARRVFN